MGKFLKNIIKLIIINTPLYIIFNFIKNFIPNYKTKKKTLAIKKETYNNFLSFNNENWFCNNLYFLKSNLKNKENIKNMLEIGSYEGRSAVFFLNLFSNSTITCVDTWDGGAEEQKFLNSKIIEKNFDTNLKKYSELNRLKKFKTTSNDFFKNNKDKFDLIYVDGDHSCKQVYIDINNSWKILNKNGFLILDDYLWWFYKDLKMNPSTAINNFIKNNYSEFSKIVVWKQIIIQKN